MALLFFGGVMNLYWIAGLAVFVLLEKTLPLGHLVGRLAGVLLVLGATRALTPRLQAVRTLRSIKRWIE
jgi:predicted metal-binding membrane protein